MSAIDAIDDLVPHTGTMLLLERVISVDDASLCAQIVVRPDTLFFDGRGVGAWIGLEYMAQAIAAHGGHAARLRGEPVKPGFLLGTRRYEARSPSFALGSVLRVHVRRAEQGENGLRVFECQIANAGDVDDPSAAPLASASIMVFVPENMDQFLHGTST